MDFASTNLRAEIARIRALPATSTLHKGCSVLEVHDGDTITVAVPGRKSKLVVRVAEIDAPEFHAFTWPDQPFCLEARNAVLNWIDGGKVDVHCNKFDPRTDRWISHVSINGAPDLSAYMVAHGFAWSYIPDPRSKIPGMMAEAKAAGIGLWADPNAIAPAAWRKMAHPKT